MMILLILLAPASHFCGTLRWAPKPLQYYGNGLSAPVPSARDYATRRASDLHRDALRTSYFQLTSWGCEAFCFVQT